MMRRPVRILVLLMTVAVTAGVVWRATGNEQARGRLRHAAQRIDATAADAIFELVDLRSSLHAYVAPGQGIDFWSKRAQAQLDSINTRLRDLEPATSAAGHPLETALSSVDGLTAAEKRARTAVEDGQPLIAGDIVFSDTRGLIDAAVRDLSDARQAMARAESAREGASANEQSLLAGGLIAVWIFALIVLLPTPSAQPVAVASTFSLSDQEGLSASAQGGRDELRRDRQSASAHVDPDELRRDRHPASAQGDRDELRRDRPEAAVVVPPARETQPDEPAARAAAPTDRSAPQSDESVAALLETTARLCTDIGRVADASDLSPLLERAAGVLGATSVVVWLVAPDGQRLVPATAHGYDETQLGRMGSIGTDDDNLTATAFRTSGPTHVSANGHVPGAVAVPILSASGTSGVLAAEVPAGTDLPRAEALAALIAAQLAGLFPAADPANMPKSEVGIER
jgi:hypothetical protein